MTTFVEMRDRALRLVNNPTAEGLEDGLVVDAVCSACDAILPWVPKLKSTSFTGDGTTTAFALPTDFYSVDALIIQETGEILPQAVFTPYQYYGAKIADTNNWILSPSGQISLSKAPASSVIYDLYYCAMWAKPTIVNADTFVLETPSYLDNALALYTAAQLLIPNAVGVALINPYKTRVDSGTPEHNPGEKIITYLMNLFNTEMSRHPRHQRAQT